MQPIKRPEVFDPNHRRRNRLFLVWLLRSNSRPPPHRARLFRRTSRPCFLYLFGRLHFRISAHFKYSKILRQKENHDNWTFHFLHRTSVLWTISDFRSSRREYSTYVHRLRHGWNYTCTSGYSISTWNNWNFWDEIPKLIWLAESAHGWHEQWNYQLFLWYWLGVGPCLRSLFRYKIWVPFNLWHGGNDFLLYWNNLLDCVP